MSKRAMSKRAKSERAKSKRILTSTACAMLCLTSFAVDAAQDPKISATSPARVSKHRLVKPSWYREDALAKWQVVDVFVGPNAALARVNLGKTHIWFSTNAKGEVQGPLRISSSTLWAGFGDDGVVYLADAQGSLSTSPSLKALRFTAPKAVDQLENIDVWDAGGTTLAALSRYDGVLYLSKDGGATFDTLMFDDAPHTLAVRSDNVIVVAGRALHVSKDGGQSWTTTQISLPNLRRVGQFIGGKKGCEEGTLARDGSTWIPHASPPSLSSWNSPFGASELPQGSRGPSAAKNQLAPLAPKATGKNALDVVNACRAQRRGGGGGGMAGMGGRALFAGTDDPCAVTRCLLVPSSTTAARFLSNGRCGDPGSVPRPLWSGFLRRARRATPEPSQVSISRNACWQNALKAPGQVVLSTSASVQLTYVKCRATRVVGRHGLTAVLCEVPNLPEATDVLVWNSTSWIRELRLVGRVRFAQQTETLEGNEQSVDDDGTLMFEVERDRKRKAWVRVPAALGMPKAWREVAIVDAVGHRALTGGRVLALARSDKKRFGSLHVTSSKFSPSAANAELQWAASAEKMTLERIESCHGARLQSHPLLQGKVDVRLHVEASGVVQAHIERIPVDDGAWSRCITEAFSQTRMFVVDRARRILIRDDVVVSMNFKAENHAIDLWVDDQGKQERIAHGVFIKGAVRDFRVRSDRSVELDVGNAKRARWVVVPIEGPLSTPFEASRETSAPASLNIDVGSVQGRLNPDDAQRILGARAESLATCWTKPHPEASTQRFQSVVSAQGQVLTVKSTSHSWRRTQCLAREIKKLQFPTTPDGISVVTFSISQLTRP